jgi:hypothetical protein
MRTKFWSENLKEGDHLGDLGMWQDNIKMGLKEIRYTDADWIHLSQDMIYDNLK